MSQITNKTILLAGDSWAAGQWIFDKKSDPSNFVNHAGIAQYITDDGYNVINLSQPGSGNEGILNVLENFLKTNIHINIDKIFLLQTDYIRDPMPSNIPNPSSITDVEVNIMMNYYKKISNVASLYDVKIYLIGGCTDLLPQSYITQFPNIVYVCQSWTNLIINNNTDIEPPIVSWYTKEYEDIINKFKKYNINDTIDKMDLAEKRMECLQSNKEYFWPDGVHPNKRGHKKLFVFLKQHNFL